MPAAVPLTELVGEAVDDVGVVEVIPVESPTTPAPASAPARLPLESVVNAVEVTIPAIGKTFAESLSS